MKRVAHIIATLAVLLLSVVLPAEALAALRANYEVTLHDHGNAYSTRTAESLEAGQPLMQELGMFRVELLPDVNADGTYSLKVTLIRAGSASDDISPAVSQSFPGSLGGPLEFSGDFGGVTISGVMMLHELAGENAGG